MSPSRRALLIGVADTPHATDVFPSLSGPVRADLALMERHLRGSGYDLDVLGADPDAGPLDLSTIATAVEAAAAHPCDLLLVYFTGHGVRIGDTDYLVPGTVRAPAGGQWTKAQVDSLLQVDLAGYLRGCKAQRVVLVVDACREEALAPADGFGAGTVSTPPGVPLAFVMGCGPGEVCHYDDQGSLFTRELAACLDPLSRERSLAEVIARAESRTVGSAAKLGRQQRPHLYGLRYDQRVEDFPDLCEASETPTGWRETVFASPLWEEHVDPRYRGEGGPAEAMRDRIAAFAHSCAESALADRRRFPDPWEDLALPLRTLTLGLNTLLAEVGDLTPVEAGLLAGLPFLHEALWARRLSEAAEARPFDLEPTPAECQRSVLRGELENVHQAHPHLLRKARGHRLRGEDDACRALGGWLTHRWVEEKLSDTTPSGDELVRRLTVALIGDDRPAAVAELAWAVGVLARSPAEAGDDGLPGRELADAPDSVLADGRHQTLRWPGVKGIALVAMLLAADARMFPDVLPDHVGVSDPLAPADVVRSLQEDLGWRREGDLHLDMLCPHQALHECLDDLAERADALVRELRGSAEQRGGSRALLLALPPRVTARGLKAARRTGGGGRAYQVPVLRFRLAQDEIRELLMGHQLYGDRSLAIRELYQNAADACRYRDLRWRYLRRVGKAPGDWTGRIRISQGRTEPVDGRPGRTYIECRDNGVGMGRTHLEQTFSRAGRRFSQTRAFRREQAEWLQADKSLKLYPYSRFGIGVLSYFMIADDITLVTREVMRGGRIADEALMVTISSSSGLFRIQPYDGEDAMPEGGTRIRLTLSEQPAGEAVSAGAVLERLVVLSEFAMQVREEDEQVRVWEAGEPRRVPPEDARTTPRFKLRAAPRRSGAAKAPADLSFMPGAPRGPVRVWWVHGNGILLADGIATEERPFGYVANLSGPQAPKLSVNRNTVIEWDKDWVARSLREAVAVLPDWPALDYAWLWQLENADPGLARAVVAELCARGSTPPLRLSPRATRPVPIAALGCLPSDGDLVNERVVSRRGRGFTVPWRLAVLHGLGAVPTGELPDAPALPEDVSGYPVPLPGDNTILNVARNGLSGLVARASEGERTLAEVLDRLRRFILLGPMAPAPAAAPGTIGKLDFVPRRHDTDLIQWMRDWADAERLAQYPPAAALLSISAAHELPVGELLERCACYAPLGLEPPAIPEPLHPYTATEADAELLAGWTPSNRGHYAVNVLPYRVRPMHVIQLARQLDLPAPDVLHQLRSWEDLGYILPDEDEVPSAELSEPDWEWLERFWEPLATGRSPSRQQLLLEAARREEPVSELLASITQLGALVGLPVPGAAGPVPAGAQLDSADMPLLTDPSEEPLRSPVLSLDHLAFAYAPGGVLPGFGSKRDDEGWEAFSARLAKLGSLGLEIPEDLAPLRLFSTLSPRDRVALLVGSLERSVPWTAATLVCTAGELKERIGESLDRLRRYADDLGKEVPALGDDALALAPSEEEANLLTRFTFQGGSPGQAVWIVPGAYELARFAFDNGLTVRAALDRLEPYRDLGARLPCPTAEQRAALDLAPDRYDLTALSDNPEAQVPVPVTSFTPLHLLYTAARLGRSAARVRARLAVFAPLGVTLHVTDAPDLVPDWRDFVLLTEGLDGQEPTRSGEVDTSLIDALAAEVDAPPTWVRERLRAYAGMFGFTVRPDRQKEDA